MKTPIVGRTHPLFVSRGLLLSLLLALATPVFSQTPVPTPLVSSPPDAGETWNRSIVNLEERGYSEEEFFFEGETTAGPYKSRMIVRRPVNPHRFNGTVIVEWMNASSGLDIDVDFLPMLPLMQAEGYAYVAVTAQQVTAGFLAGRTPERYGALSIPEAARFEVFSQAGKALRENGSGLDPMQGLKVRRLIAIGQSQSSGQLTTYVNTVHGLVLEPVFDGYIPHAGGPAPTRFPAPVFKVNSETEAPGYFGQRGTADPNYRYWEIAGTAHQPLEGTDYANYLLLEGRGSAFTCPFPFEGVGGPVPSGPSLRAAVHHLNHWIKFGIAPPDAPLIEMTANPSNPSAGIIQRDEYGNALGGIRMPQQEAPTGRNTPSYGCAVSVPFPPYTIILDTWPQYDAFDGNNDPGVDPTDVYAEPSDAGELYRNHGRYVRKFTKATVRSLFDGHILWFDAIDMISEAAKSDVAR